MSDIVESLRAEPHRVSSGLALEAAAEIERLRKERDRAYREINRLMEVIDSHVHHDAKVLANHYDIIVAADPDRTVVKLTPRALEFSFAKSLDYWSNEHKTAFSKQIIRALGEVVSEDICREIWSVKYG